MKILPPRGSRTFYFSILLALLGLIAFLFWPLLPIGAPFGYIDAKRDIKSGHIALRLQGRWDHCYWKKWKATLREQYHIEIEGRHHSSFSGGFLGSYDQAYNSTQMQEILRLYGHDVVEEERIRAYEAEKKASR